MVVVLSVSAAIAFLLFAVRETPQKKKVVQTPPKVRCIQAVTGNSAMRVEAFGTVTPRNSVKLAMETAGRIDYIHPDFKEGALVLKGQLLLRIDPRTLVLNKKTASVRVDQARADIRLLEQETKNLKADADLAKSNLSLSIKELERVKALSKNQFASKNSLDKAEQQYLAAKNQLQAVTNALELMPARLALKKSALAAAIATYDQAALTLEKSEIRTGFDGYVLKKNVQEDEFVNPGQVLGVIYEKGALDVDVGIQLEDIQWLGSVFTGQAAPKAQVTIANLEGIASPVWPARVARIKAGIDETTRTLPMTLEIGPLEIDALGATDTTDATDPLLALKPGGFVKCLIDGQERKTFAVPRFLMRSPDTLFLARDNCLVIQKVTVIRRFEDTVYIGGGLSHGDLIIESPLPGAVDGMALTVIPAGADQ